MYVKSRQKQDVIVKKIFVIKSITLNTRIIQRQELLIASVVNSCEKPTCVLLFKGYALKEGSNIWYSCIIKVIKL